MASIEKSVGSFRERGLLAQKKAEEAGTDGLKAFWLELSERYFELAAEAARQTPSRFTSDGRSRADKTSLS